MIDNMICLDKNYSTTKLLTQELPVIIKNPEDKFETVLFLPNSENRKGEGGLRTKDYFKKSFENKPLLSIITVVFNGEEFLEETILSVINQTYDNVEYIIIDGGSSDGTLDIIKKYEDKIDYWVSEKDKGIYDAMNKGILLATGCYIYFIGSDDSLIDDSIYKLFTNFQLNTNELIALPIVINDTNKLAYPNIGFPVAVIHHQGAIFSLLKLKQIGLYNNKYKLHSDFSLMCDYVSKHGVIYIENPICRFRKGGVSTSGSNAIQSMNELLNIYFRNNGKILSTKWIMFIIRPLYYYINGLLQK